MTSLRGARPRPVAPLTDAFPETKASALDRATPWRPEPAPLAGRAPLLGSSPPPGGQPSSRAACCQSPALSQSWAVAPLPVLPRR
eukprot:353460-Chlamydomonas_euryale.AAC.15